MDCGRLRIGPVHSRTSQGPDLVMVTALGVTIALLYVVLQSCLFIHRTVRELRPVLRLA